MWLCFNSISSSSTAPLSYFYTVDTGSYFGTPLEILSTWSSVPHRVPQGYRDPLLYLRPNERAFVRVFRFRSSEIAPSVPRAREAPDSALTRISTSLPRDNRSHLRGQDEVSIHSQAEIGGSDRDWRKLKKRG